jgi:predicted membrane metal-binding protein
VFSATGTTHLVAISGMHVTLFACRRRRSPEFFGRAAYRYRVATRAKPLPVSVSALPEVMVMVGFVY